jgi:hypothetical protein
MSTTTNVQNLITTVFRPVYYYAEGVGFTPHMEMSNIDTYIGNEVRVFRAQVGTSIGNNVYVGVGAGQAYTEDSENVNLTAVGYNAGAGARRVTRAVYLGSDVGANVADAVDVIAIGAFTKGAGSNNIFIGNSTGNAGSNNIYIGHNLVPPGNTSNALNINNLVFGSFSNQWVGIGTSNRTTSAAPLSLDVSGGVYISGKMGIQMQPYNSLNVNGATQSTGGYYSSSGSNVVAGGGVVTIGTFGDGTSLTKLGNTLISVQDITTAGVNYETGLYVNVSGTVIRMTNDVSNGYTHIVNPTSSYPNIQISNSDGSSHTLYWSITHFPLTP